MNNPITLNKIEFVIGDFYAESSNSNTNSFCLANDSSLLYQSAIYGNYSILLGGNWRFELIVDSHTCLCIKFQSFLDGMKVLHQPLLLPESKARKVFVKSNDAMHPGEGCHYHPFTNVVCWDDKKKILCIGNPESNGEAIEFVPNATMVIKNHQLLCIYLELSNISNLGKFL